MPAEPGPVISSRRPLFPGLSAVSSSPGHKFCDNFAEKYFSTPFTPLHFSSKTCPQNCGGTFVTCRFAWISIIRHVTNVPPHGFSDRL